MANYKLVGTWIRLKNLSLTFNVHNMYNSMANPEIEGKDRKNIFLLACGSFFFFTIVISKYPKHGMEWNGSDT